MEDQQKDRLRGALLGLAIGDALGTTLEFAQPGTFLPVKEMMGGGPFHLEAGQWTDDTSMALCLAESLIERGKFDAVDQLKRYVRWWEQGHLSSTGSCFDIGTQTRSALIEFKKTGQPRCGETGDCSAGNGSLMRLVPVAMAYHNAPESAVAYAGESSRTTHGARECIDACRYFSGLLVGAFSGTSKKDLLGQRYSPVKNLWQRAPLAPKITAVADGSFQKKHPPAIRGTGYVVDCLEASLWAVWNSSSFEEAVLAAVNLGDDADTTGAVCGQLAGAVFGASAIPKRWLEKIALRLMIEEFINGLTTFA